MQFGGNFVVGNGQAAERNRRRAVIGERGDAARARNIDDIGGIECSVTLDIRAALGIRVRGSFVDLEAEQRYARAAVADHSRARGSVARLDVHTRGVDCVRRIDKRVEHAT
ncbi:hypothetical protein SDC9_102288 [bioreactor metagenome]|uniref:Uncharacterized protein n=1 Tax=bioreactor metagenome TaxID=1076179 RepID=A0A645AT44_9ZZZZ